MAKRTGGKRGAKRPGELEYFARCAGGFEEVLGRELHDLGFARVRPQVGGVIFFGDKADGYRACLWSRVAMRIQLVLDRVTATDADALYRGIRDMPWEDHVPAGATIAVDAHGENDELRNTKFTALKVKDALCDRLRELRGARPDVDPRDPDVAVNVALHPRKATIYLNLSGASLHRRGYREDGVQTEAPLKETLAASVLLAAGWPEIAAAGGNLIDPMCGSGTFAVEAALIAANVAPGLLRERWGFEGWAQHDAELWETVRGEAEAERDWSFAAPRVLAGDIDERAVTVARDNARRADVEDLVRFYVGDAAQLSRHMRALRGAKQGAGLLVCNPPYGIRLSAGDELPAVHEALAAAVDSVPASWELALITPDTGIDTALGRVPETELSCYNGPIEAWVRLYHLTEKPQVQQVVTLDGATVPVRIAEPGSAQFAGRLRKMAKERARWARGQEIGCYRVYDADLPDFALSVDLYQGVAGDGREEGRCLVVEERRRPASIDPLRAGRRLADAVALSCATLGVARDRAIVRPWVSPRDRKRDRSVTEPWPVSVVEHGFTFDIDLNGKPDSGLPLQMRGVRKLVGELAAGKRVVALGASAGAVALYAAAAGASSTVAVDAFADRVDWMRETMAAGGFRGKRYRFVREDLRSWLEHVAHTTASYDLLVLAPPSWMAARESGGGDFDLKRDCMGLLRTAGSVLAPGGTCVFACSERDVALDGAALAKAGLAVEDVSARTLPADFARSARDYRCWLVRKA